MGRRFFCLCLCVLLLCSVLPMRIVSAEEPEQKREDALPEDARDSQGAEKADDETSGSAEPIGSSEANAVVGTSGDGIADETPSGGNADRPEADGVQGEDDADASGAAGETLGTEQSEDPTKEPDTQASDPNMSDPLPDAAPIDEQPNDTVSAPVPDEPSGKDFSGDMATNDKSAQKDADADENADQSTATDANAVEEIGSEEPEDSADSVNAVPALRSAGVVNVAENTEFSPVSLSALQDGDIVVFFDQYESTDYIMGFEAAGKGLRAIKAPERNEQGKFVYLEGDYTFFRVEKPAENVLCFHSQHGYLTFLFENNAQKLSLIPVPSVSDTQNYRWTVNGGGIFTAPLSAEDTFYIILKYTSKSGIVFMPYLGNGSSIQFYKAGAVVSPATYTVTFDANGGSGAPSAIEVPEDDDCTIPDDVPVREGYTFLGWAESADAATAAYQPGDTYTGRVSVTLYAVWQENVLEPTGPEAVFIGNTLVLDGTIGINFYVNVNGDPTGVTAALSDGSITKTYTVADAEYVEQYAGYRIPFRYIPAAEIDKKVTLRMYDANGNELSLKDENGYAVEASRCSYSVADWGINMRHKETETEATRQFAAALLNYGTYADAYFHQTGLNPSYLLSDMDDYMDRAQFDPVIPSNAAEVGYLGATLLLQNDTAIRLYFSKSIKIPDVDSGKYTVGHNDKGYYVEKPNIGATKLGHKYTFTIQYNEKTYSFQYAALSYANDRIRYGDDGIRNLCKALYAYYETACAYFAELQN